MREGNMWCTCCAIVDQSFFAGIVPSFCAMLSTARNPLSSRTPLSREVAFPL